MAINGRAKGKKAELVVAKLFEAWWRQVEPVCRFVRTPSSGGWHGPDVRAEFHTSGDLMSTAQRWPFSVECKKREGWTIDNVVRGRASPVWAWLEQCDRAAAEDGRAPLLVLGRNRAPWLAMLRRGQLAEEVLAAVGQEHDLMVDVTAAVVLVHLDRLLAVDPRLFARAT